MGDTEVERIARAEGANGLIATTALSTGEAMVRGTNGSGRGRHPRVLQGPVVGLIDDFHGLLLLVVTHGIQTVLVRMVAAHLDEVGFTNASGVGRR